MPKKISRCKHCLLEISAEPSSSRLGQRFAYHIGLHNNLWPNQTPQDFCVVLIDASRAEEFYSVMTLTFMGDSC